VKTRKWYSTNIKPDRTNDLIIMTDMGYIFESIYKNGKFLVSIVKNYKVYFEEWIEQENIIKWMKV
jgi:hypothetical protein